MGCTVYNCIINRKKADGLILPDMIRTERMEEKMSEILMNKEQIMEIIPHRAPFLLIDEIVEMEVGVSVKARKYIKEDDFWFKGHFPDYPVTPGVLMVEMLAQAGAVCMLSKPDFKGKIGLFGGIDKAKFRRQVIPGDVLDLEVEIIRQRGPVATCKCLASVDGEKAVSCEITCIIADGDK